MSENMNLIAGLFSMLVGSVIAPNVTAADGRSPQRTVRVTVVKGGESASKAHDCRRMLDSPGPAEIGDVYQAVDA